MSYADLKEPGVPKVIQVAYPLIGTKEVVGKANNPTIMSWARELKIPYDADAVPWCGLFIAYVVEKAGYKMVPGPLSSRAWARWGSPADVPSLGDILVFWRGSPNSWQGHVGIYVGEDALAYHVLGGNQGDSVSIIRIAKHRLVAARRSPWKVAQPASVKPIQRTGSGGLSTNEA